MQPPKIPRPHRRRACWTVQSSPVDGVAISVSPLDTNGLGSGVSGFTRTYENNATVFLTAPVVVGERFFKRWLRDGTAFSNNRVTAFALDADRTLTAVYDYPLDGRITAIAREGADLRVTWSSVGGRTYVVQATSNLAAGFTDITSPIFVPGTERATRTFLDIGAAGFPMRFYRLRITTP